MGTHLFGSPCIRTLSQIPGEKIDKTIFKTEYLNFLVALCMHIKKTIYIGGSCCQHRDFRFRCSSASHKRSKFNSKCGPPFSPSCACARSAGSYFHSIEMCHCPMNLSVISGIICVTSKTALVTRSLEYFMI